MALQKLSPVTLVAAAQKRIREYTGLKCYDAVPNNAKSPFYFVEVVKILPQNTKTMFRDEYTVWIHCIAEENNSSAGVYKLIEKLEEALTEDVTLPEPFELLMQTDEGVQAIKTDETGEKHAVVSFNFSVCYGFRCK